MNTQPVGGTKSSIFRGTYIGKIESIWCRNTSLTLRHLQNLAINNNFKILTLDTDFTNYKKFIDIHLENVPFD